MSGLNIDMSKSTLFFRIHLIIHQFKAVGLLVQPRNRLKAPTAHRCCTFTVRR